MEGAGKTNDNEAGSSSNNSEGSADKSSKDEAGSSSDNENKSSEDDGESISGLLQMLQKLGLDMGHVEPPEIVLSELTLKGVADYISSDKCKKIIVMTGAGVSTSAGIPDFRTPGTGLYSQLEKYNLPHPQAIFELDYYKTNPEPFCMLAKEMWPGNYKPTISHYFLCLLEKKNLLLRAFTQNIDGLELVAGLPEDRLVAAHGGFHTSHCIDCKALYMVEWMKGKIFAGEIPRCTEKECGGLVKPDIVFFGESLPERFFTTMTDFSIADLLIVMGTSLKVQPFCLLVDKVEKTVPRLLINLEKCGVGQMGMFGYGFDFDSESKYRDVALLTDCDSGCLELAELLGWKEELLELAKCDNTPGASGK